MKCAKCGMVGSLLEHKCEGPFYLLPEGPYPWFLEHFEEVVLDYTGLALNVQPFVECILVGGPLHGQSGPFPGAEHRLPSRLEFLRPISEGSTFPDMAVYTLHPDGKFYFVPMESMTP